MKHFLNTLAFEAVEDPSAAELGGGETPAGETAAEQTAAAETPAETSEQETPAAPAIDWEDPEVQYQVDQRAAAVLDDRLADLQPEPTSDSQGDGTGQLPDPLEDPEGFAGGILGAIEQLIDKRLGPVNELVEHHRGEQAQGYVSELVDSLPQVAALAELLPAPAEGEEDTRHNAAADFIELAASGFLPAAEARYGEGQRAVNAAIRAGAEHVEKTLKSVYDAGRKAREAELRNIGVAPEDAAGGGPALNLDEQPDDIYDAASQYVARHTRS